MPSEPVVLFDLPDKGDPSKAWSLNPWKTRLILNYKGIPYKTEWVEYPDIATRFEDEFSIPPHPEGTNIASYTIPAVLLPNKTYLMDSLPIAHALDALSPQPPLHLSSPYLDRVLDVLPKAIQALAPIYIPRIPRLLLPTRSAEYFIRTREERFKQPLSQLENGPSGGAAAWDAANPNLKAISAMLREDGSGPFFMGKEASYADFVLVGFMKMFERIGQLEMILLVDKEAFGGVWEASQQWLERDDH